MGSSIPKRRNGYYYKDDVAYPSVTTIISKVLAKPALYYWSGREAAKIALKDPTLNETEVMAILAMQVKETQERGKSVHTLAEFLAKGKFSDYEEAKKWLTNRKYKGYGEALVRWWETNQPEVIDTEVELFSERHCYAGTCDFLCVLNGQKWLIDWKTGKGIYKEVGLQLAAYREALSENSIINIDRTGVVLCKEDGEFVFQETRATIHDFINVMKVWEWLNKKGE